MNRHLLRGERRRRKKGDTARLAERLAPLEEQDKRGAKDEDDFAGALRHTVAHHEPGAIVVERDSRGVSEDRRNQAKNLGGLEAVVIVILCLVLGWIVFITWQISLMPN
jgi:hypothetical protein